MVKVLLKQRLLMSMVMMLVVCVGLSSCESLRKKFTRQKKQNQKQGSELQPILEPEEYPAPQSSAAFNYRQHYSLIKVWYRDLWTGIDERDTDAKVKYALKQMFNHIDQMKSLLKPEKGPELDKLTALLKFYRDSLQQPRFQRNYSRIQSDLRAFDRMLRKQFRVDAVKGDLIGP